MEQNEAKMAVVDLNEVETLVTIFDKDPQCGWGLRGDPYLWNLLRAKVGSGVPPNTAEEFKATIEEVYKKTTGVSVSDTGHLSEDGNEEDFVSLFNEVGDGESCGWISRAKWRNEIIPILLKRFADECEPALRERWMRYQDGPKRRFGAYVAAFLRWVNLKWNDCIAEDLKPICFKEFSKDKGCFFDGKHNRIGRQEFGDLLEQYVKAKDEAMQDEWDEIEAHLND